MAATRAGSARRLRSTDCPRRSWAWRRPDFTGDSLKSDPPDFWVPLAMEPPLSPDNALLNQTNHYWMVLDWTAEAGSGAVAGGGAHGVGNSAVADEFDRCVGVRPAIDFENCFQFVSGAQRRDADARFLRRRIAAADDHFG